MSYLETLARLGVRASIRAEGILWLEPKSAITDDIRKLVRENRDAIIEEIQRAVDVSTGHERKLEYLFPKDGAWPFSARVTPEAVARVDAVREEALELGWTEAGLYQNRGQHPFPCGQDYGLVCFLTGARQVEEITQRSIEIVDPRQDKSNRLYNPHAPQPWVNRGHS